MTNEFPHVTHVTLGFGAISVGAATFRDRTLPLGIIFQPLFAPAAIGQSLIPEGADSVPVDFSKETVFITFENLACLEVLQTALNKVRETLTQQKVSVTE